LSAEGAIAFLQFQDAASPIQAFEYLFAPLALARGHAPFLTCKLPYDLF
jgi:hypothetical protein